MDYLEKERNYTFAANLIIFKTILSMILVFFAFYIYTRNKKAHKPIKQLNYAALKGINDRDFDHFKSALDDKLETFPNDFNCMPGGNTFFHIIAAIDIRNDDKQYNNLSKSLAKNANFYTKTVDYLIEKNCDIDIRDNQGRTALFSACWWNCEFMVHLFLSRGANPNLKIDVFYGYRIMSCLLFKRYFDLAAILFENHKIDFSAILNDIEGFKDVFRNDICDKDIQRMISLVTLFQRRKQIIQLLCVYNSSKNVQDRSCVELLDESSVHFFIRNYLIKNF